MNDDLFYQTQSQPRLITWASLLPVILINFTHTISLEMCSKGKDFILSILLSHLRYSSVEWTRFTHLYYRAVRTFQNFGYLFFIIIFQVPQWLLSVIQTPKLYRFCHFTQAKPLPCNENILHKIDQVLWIF